MSYALANTYRGIAYNASPGYFTPPTHTVSNFEARSQLNTHDALFDLVANWTSGNHEHAIAHSPSHDLRTLPRAAGVMIGRRRCSIPPPLARQHPALLSMSLYRVPVLSLSTRGPRGTASVPLSLGPNTDSHTYTV